MTTKSNVIKFPGNPRPVTKPVEPCWVVILPVIRIEGAPTSSDGHRRRRGRRRRVSAS